MQRYSITIDIIDYITGIGNNGQSVSPCNPVKMENFSNTFNNISVLKALTNLKIRYPSGDGLLPPILAMISFVYQYLKRSSPNNQIVSKWRRFGSFSTFCAQLKPPCSQKVAIPVDALHSLAVNFSVWPPLPRELRYSPKTCFTQAQGRNIQKHYRKQGLATLSTKKRCQIAALAVNSSW